MRNALFCIIFLHAVWSWAQVADSVPATYLQEVKIYGIPPAKYAAGARVEKLQIAGSDILLTDALNGNSSIYFKTYGNHQLSTIAFRGTSASHTAVLWNGVNINSPSLGQTDFSLLPVFLLDDISVQFGTSSSLYGTDALGGSVLLNTASPLFERGMKFQVRQDIGSFGNLFSGLKLEFSNNRWHTRTKLMLRSVENNFPFTSPAVGYEKVQQHAAVQQYGVDQQFHYQFSAHSYLSLNVLYTYNFREIQPVVTNDVSDETLEDRNTRINLSYHGASVLGNIYVSTSFMDNFQQYSISSPNRTQQLNALVNIDKQLHTRTDIRYGASATVFLADMENYEAGLTDTRYDIFGSLTHGFTSTWKASLNLRQSFYENYKAPIAPSVGTEYNWLTKGRHVSVLKFQASRGFRVPTLNDRYWRPGGNPGLKPEDAWHVEGGMTWQYRQENHIVSSSITSYHTRAHDWILWQPANQGYWAPNNLQRVHVYGVELQLNSTIKQQKFSLETNVQYSYTRSKNKEGLTPNDLTTVNSQLLYVPYHQASLHSTANVNAWSAGLVVSYTGLRYTTLDNQAYLSLPAYAIANLMLDREFLWNTWKITGRAGVNNIFNTYYENYMNLAMPGRNYSLSIILNFNQNQIKP
ncbi:MAG: TonB-dependent receptor [Cyclobacteriaceae bacterium]|nr:TonB-dependent receptor [Cyclobacteriaceae bacterium]